MSARDDYPVLWHFINGKPMTGMNGDGLDIAIISALSEIDVWRGRSVQIDLLLKRRQTEIDLLIDLGERLKTEAKLLKRALGELTDRNSALIAERRQRDIRFLALKAGLEQGRQEELDRKGEPLPTAREIMDASARKSVK